ncbi:hypothetical protein J6590_095613 [Homalodisca vitripennis]|nr:hypothetical protein J6590_095613 [Homalodisca vitripennis]
MARPVTSETMVNGVCRPEAGLLVDDPALPGTSICSVNNAGATDVVNGQQLNIYRHEVHRILASLTTSCDLRDDDRGRGYCDDRALPVTSICSVNNAGVTDVVNGQQLNIYRHEVHRILASLTTSCDLRDNVANLFNKYLHRILASLTTSCDLRDDDRGRGYCDDRALPVTSICSVINAGVTDVVNGQQLNIYRHEVHLANLFNKYLHRILASLTTSCDLRDDDRGWGYCDDRALPVTSICSVNNAGVTDVVNGQQLNIYRHEVHRILASLTTSCDLRDDDRGRGYCDDRALPVTSICSVNNAGVTDVVNGQQLNIYRHEVHRILASLTTSCDLRDDDRGRGYCDDRALPVTSICSVINAGVTDVVNGQQLNIYRHEVHRILASLTTSCDLRDDVANLFNKYLHRILASLTTSCDLRDDDRGRGYCDDRALPVTSICSVINAGVTDVVNGQQLNIYRHEVHLANLFNKYLHRILASLTTSCDLRDDDRGWGYCDDRALPVTSICSVNNAGVTDVVNGQQLNIYRHEVHRILASLTTSCDLRDDDRGRGYCDDRALPVTSICSVINAGVTDVVNGQQLNIYRHEVHRILASLTTSCDLRDDGEWCVQTGGGATVMIVHYRSRVSAVLLMPVSLTW